MPLVRWLLGDLMGVPIAFNGIENDLVCVPIVFNWIERMSLAHA